MSTFALFEAKNRLSELVERAARGEEIVIPRHGEPMAKLTAAAARAPDDKARAIAERIRSSRCGHPLGEDVSLRELVEDGRKH